MSLFHFKNLYVRELAWVMCSPNLLAPSRRSQRGELELPLVWDADCRGYYQQFLSRLEQLDQSPEDLLAWLANLRSPRLGLRFEHYLHYWLRWIAPHSDALCHGLTLNEPGPGGRTLGQLDFLWRDQNGLTQHWEAAVKFYLYWPNMPAWHDANGEAAQWLGPNANDCFEAKLTHLRQRQLPIAASETARQALQQGNWSLPAHSAAFVKGYLFYPLAADNVSESTATWRLGGETRVIAPSSNAILEQPLSRAHLKGWWQHFSAQQLRMPRVSPHSQWLVLPKQYWMAPLCAPSVADLAALQLSLFDDQQLQQFAQSHFQHSPRSLMIVEMKNEPESVYEISRGMLTHPEFPFLRTGS